MERRPKCKDLDDCSKGAGQQLPAQDSTPHLRRFRQQPSEDKRHPLAVTAGERKMFSKGYACSKVISRAHVSRRGQNDTLAATLIHKTQHNTATSIRQQARRPRHSILHGYLARPQVAQRAASTQLVTLTNATRHSTRFSNAYMRQEEHEKEPKRQHDGEQSTSRAAVMQVGSKPAANNANTFETDTACSRLASAAWRRDLSAAMDAAVSRVVLDAHGEKTRSPLSKKHGPSGGSSSRINADLRVQRYTNNDDQARIHFPILWRTPSLGDMRRPRYP
jgi:hypothetical protein